MLRSSTHHVNGRRPLRAQKAAFIAVLGLAAGACGGGTAANLDAATPAAAPPHSVTTTASAPEPVAAATSPATASATTAPDVPAYPQPQPGIVDDWVPEVRAEHSHDPAAFTQGLVVVGDTFYESTGRYGESSVRTVDVATGQSTQVVRLAPELFGEGLALVEDRLIQLTWQEGIAIAWTLQLDEVERFVYSGEGWGLCDDGMRLVMSDGSAQLQFRDRATFQPLGSVEVTWNGVPVTALNELECVDGLVFANVWKSTDILVIDPREGMVTAVIDAAALDEWSGEDPAAVLNGIAYDDRRNVFYLTGKLWPVMYEVVFLAGS